jgi:3-oxoacyl-[acyl-carrier-protein] synthase-1
MTASPALVTGIGAFTALGEDRASTCAALRSGIAALMLTKRFPLLGPDPEWDPPEPIRAARLPTLPVDLPAPERLRRMAIAAMGEAMRSAGIQRGDLPSTALLVAVPSGDGAVAGWRLDDFANEIVREAGLSSLALVEQRANGHASVVELLHRAAEIAGDRRARRRVVVLGADTYLSSDRVRELDAAGRLASERAPEGFSAGEGAVALVVDSRPEKAPLARLTAFGFGHEADAYASDRAPSGKGMEAAILAACAGLPDDAQVAWILSDLNGEPYRAMEWGAAASRLGARVAEELEMQHPADALGDIGCASGALLVAMAVDALAEGYAPSVRAFVSTASDAGARAVVRVEPVEPAQTAA